MENENLEEKEIQESADNQIEEPKTEDNSEQDVSSNENGESPKADTKSELEVLQDELSESKDKYLRLYSEFENFRRRTAKEKLEMVQTDRKSVV